MDFAERALTRGAEREQMVRRGFSVLLTMIAVLIVTGCGGTEDKGGAPGERENTESGSGSASETTGGETAGGAEGGQGTAIVAGETIFGTSYISPLVEILVTFISGIGRS